MTRAQRLTPLDASFLHLETPATHMHIGGVAIFEPSPRGSGRALYESILQLIGARIVSMPRYRQKVAFVPLNLDVPVWIDDASFDLRNHVLRDALPSPGGDRELEEFCARLFSFPLDRSKPLWEIHIVEGLANGRWALVSKTHHGMVDGKSNLELVSVLFDTAPDAPAPAAPAETWRPEPEPSGLDLMLAALRDQAQRPARLVTAAKALADDPQTLVASLKETASGLAAVAVTIRAPKSILNGPTSPSRSYRTSRFALDEFKDVKRAFGGTINDAVLAVVAGGLRRYLQAVEGDEAGNQTIQALCPVSIRDDSERSALGNRLAMMLVRLPLSVSDPKERYGAIRSTVERLKVRRQAVGADFLLNLAGFAPATLHAMVARSSIRQIGFNLVVTNVPGPQFPLYLAGARLLEVFPIAFLYDGQYLAVAVFSYCGWLNFGYLADRNGFQDIELLADSMEESFHELVHAAHHPRTSPRTERRSRSKTSRR